MHQGIFIFSSWQGPVDWTRNYGNNSKNKKNHCRLKLGISEKCSSFIVTFSLLHSASTKSIPLKFFETCVSHFTADMIFVVMFNLIVNFCLFLTAVALLMMKPSLLE